MQAPGPGSRASPVTRTPAASIVPPPMRLFDAHNHLHDERFGGAQDLLLAACRDVGVVRMVVNGSCPGDWPAVADLARRHPGLIIPAFGVHPWYVHQRGEDWQDSLRRHLDASPEAVVGEIGLDRWILDCPPAARAAVSPELADWPAAGLEEQREVFAWQLALAAERGVSASIHCLQAWGPLHDQVRSGPRPAVWLLHSYGGPVELVEPLARFGAHFSFPGYFLHPRKARQRDVFQRIPLDRLLAETDAPDQRLPARLDWGVETDVLHAPDGRPLNHPSNLRWVVEGLARLRGVSAEALAPTLEENFNRLFPPPRA